MTKISSISVKKRNNNFSLSSGGELFLESGSADENEESEGEADYFPIDEPTEIQSSQSNNKAPTTATQARDLTGKSKKNTNFDKTGVNVYSQDENFQYEGENKCFYTYEKQFFFTLIDEHKRNVK